ncbi:hypothetical protein CANCADRAFT_2279 [Tortispora caseinolytica NRRL Y-17796]|uniref:Uncharacterized protein n=1 Tax=Tortispora caseinolytica NRRL Y-17796 TaxID=767744 RepID=A0A1E4TFP9_9ASCO|nr:hypothetical protein CANCADRAFT_2279 [Tortispora caseinolytica NRRL Y-17796]
MSIDRFKQYFESNFTPLESDSATKEEQTDRNDSSTHNIPFFDFAESDSSDASDSSDSSEEIQTIDYSNLSDTISQQQPSDSVLSSRAEYASDDESQNLINDLELQRLISESRILAQNSSATRLKSLQHRLSYSSGKDLAYYEAGHNAIPMNIRKSINKHRKEAQKQHEERAKDAGIILAKSSSYGPLVQSVAKNSTPGVYKEFAPIVSAKKKTVSRRDRGLKINSVGKSMHGGLYIPEMGRKPAKKGRKR